MFISSETIRITQLVAKYQSITLAAEQLNKVPSAISYTIRKLEESLDAKLFFRQGRELILTTAGSYFIQYSKSILDEMEALKHNTMLVQSGVEQSMSIAVNNIVPQQVLTQFIIEFEQQFPLTQLNLTIEVYNGTWDALYSRRADLAVGAPNSVPSTEGIISELIGQMDWDFVVSPHHPLAAIVTPLQNEQLRQYAVPCIKDTSTNFTPPRHAWLLEGQKPIYVPNLDMAYQLIQSGICIGYLPRYLCMTQLNNGGLIKKPMQEHKHPTPLFLAYRSDKKGKVRQWCINYLLQAEIKAQWCGCLSA